VLHIPFHKTVNLFVYGSLLSGEPNHRRLKQSTLLARCRTVARYTLVDLGAYPALLQRGTTSVLGEVYDVDEATLDSLDAFEGHPILYWRVPIRMRGGRAAAGYVLRQKALARGRPILSGGDWRHRRNETRMFGDSLPHWGR
jgi:gamma-glutamylaminecyclotransferase